MYENSNGSFLHIKQIDGQRKKARSLTCIVTCTHSVDKVVLVPKYVSTLIVYTIHTIWQNKRAYMISRQASSKLKKYRFGTIRSAYSRLPRFWYGWLGRGTLDDLTNQEYEQYLKNKDNKYSIQKAKRRNSKIRWEYRQERLKKRFIQLLAKFGIKITHFNKDDKGDDFYEEFKKFSKK